MADKQKAVPKKAFFVPLGISQLIEVVPWHTNNILIIAQNSKLCSFILRYSPLFLARRVKRVSTMSLVQSFAPQTISLFLHLRAITDSICLFLTRSAIIYIVIHPCDEESLLRDFEQPVARSMIVAGISCSPP